MKRSAQIVQHPLHGRMRAVLHPVPGPPGLIRLITMFRHEPLKPHPTRYPEWVGADLATLELANEDALRPAREQALEVHLAHAKRQLPEIVAILDEHVECAELDLVIVLAAVERIEICDAIDAQDHGLAIEHEPALADLTSRFHDPRIPAGPVVAAAGDQANVIPIALKAEPVSVVLHFVAPVGAVVDLVRRQKANVLNMRRR